jgi:hypothetical protein
VPRIVRAKRNAQAASAMLQVMAHTESRSAIADQRKAIGMKLPTQCFADLLCVRKNCKIRNSKRIHCNYLFCLSKRKCHQRSRLSYYGISEFFISRKWFRFWCFRDGLGWLHRRHPRKGHSFPALNPLLFGPGKLLQCKIHHCQLLARHNPRAYSSSHELKQETDIT